MVGYFYDSIIAVVILYVNTVYILKKVNEKQNTTANTVLGSICCIVILASIWAICGR